MKIQDITPKKLLISLIILGFISRVACLYFLETRNIIFMDENAYVDLAQSMIHKQTFSLSFDGFINKKDVPTAYYGMLFPSLVAATSGWGHFFEPSQLSARCLNLLLSTATLPLLYVLTGSLIPPLILALNPQFTIYSVSAMTEPLYTLLLLLATLLFVKIIRRPDRIDSFFLCGVVLGFSALTRSVSTPLLVIAIAVFGIFWLRSKKTKPWLTGILLFIAGFFVVTSPWLVRNYMLFGKMAPLETKFGHNLYVYNVPGCDMYNDKCDKLDLSADYTDDLARDSMMTTKAISMIKDSPGTFFVNSIRRLGFFWSPVPQFTKGGVLTAAVLGGMNILFFLLAGIGIFSKNSQNAGPDRYAFFTMLALIVIFTGFHSLTNASMRMRLGIEPYIAAFAGIGVSRIVFFFKNFQARKL